MKKFLSIAFAGILALAAVSCAKDEKAVFKTSNATVPEILSGTGTAKVTFHPGEFHLGFNDSLKTFHSLALVNISDSVKVNQTLSGTKIDTVSVGVNEGEKDVLSASISKDKLTAAVLPHGYKYGDVVTLELVVRASIQDPAKSVTNGYVDSKTSYTFDLKLKKPAGGAYAAFTEDSAWSVIGAIASTGNNWNKDEAMSSDGTWHVCEGLELKASDQFKFRKDGDWGTNFGAADGITEEPFVVTLDEEQSAGAGGKNLAVPEDGVYDLLLNPDAGLYKIVVHKEDPFAKYNQDSDWSVIGAIASTGNSWNSDEDMMSDGTWHVCRSLELSASDQFKFRKDGDWGTNFGAAEGITDEPFVVTLGVEQAAGANGKNLAVPEDGVYNLFLNPDDKLYKIEKAQ